MKRTKSGAAVVGAKRNRATRANLMAVIVESNREHETKDARLKTLRDALDKEERENAHMRLTNGELSRQLREAERELSWIHRHATAKTIGAKRSFDGYQIDLAETPTAADMADHINRR